MQKQTNQHFLENLISTSVSRPIAVSMAVLAICVFGFVSYQRLPVNLMPPISYPTITVRTEYPGSAPEEVEKNITEPIEEALAAISNLVSYSSVSRSGLSDVILEFNWNTDLSVIIQDIREQLDRIRLPKEAVRPLILRYDPSLDPIMRVGLYYKNAKGLSLEEQQYKLRDLAEFDVKRVLETVQGVASVKIKGGLEEEIRIELNEKFLTARGITIDSIVQRITEENLNTPCGTLREGERSYLVRTRNEFQDLDEIRNLQVATKSQIGIPLSDIGRVIRTHQDREVITRVAGRAAVEIEIYKEANANIVSVAEAVRLKLFGLEEQNNAKDKSQKNKDNRDRKKRDRKKRAQVRMNSQGDMRVRNRGAKSVTSVSAELPKEVSLELLSDQSKFIEKAIDEVINTCIVGGILAVLVLYVFLRHAFSTIVIAIAIPISIVSTFAPLHLSGTSLNIMSLGGLALGIGMLVDNAIVVLESIVRCRNEGDDAVTSSVRGTYEVGGAITASTLTTVAVFFPIVYLQGIAGQIFQDQAITVVFSLMASLVTALVVIPVLSSRNFMALQSSENASFIKQNLNIDITYQLWQEYWKKSFIHNIIAILLGLISLVLEVAGKLLLVVMHYLLKLLKYVLGSMILLLKMIFWPILQVSQAVSKLGGWYPKILRFSLRYPLILLVVVLLLIVASVYCLFFFIGAELVPEMHQGEFTIHISMPVGYPLDKTDVIARQFEKKLQEFPEIKKIFTKVGVEKTSTTSTEEGEHTTAITCILDTEQVPSFLEKQFIQKLRPALKHSEVKSIRFSRPTLFSIKNPIEVQIYGYDLETTKKLAQSAVQELQHISKLYDLKVSLEKGNPEFQISYNRQFLFNHRLQLANVAATIRRKIQGENVGKFRTPEKEIPIVVRIDSEDRKHLQSLQNMVVDQQDTPKYLKDVGDISEEEGPSEIRHLGQQRVILIQASLYGIDLQAMVGEIEKKLNNMQWPAGYYFRVGGQTQEQKVAMTSMQFALFLAAFLVYVIMASQFESLLQPFIIMFTLPLAFIGVIFGLAILQIPISVIVLIGVIMLAGIVVNNAIVMLDCINQLRLTEGLSVQEAVIQGAQIRLRPILMTTLTTILGLLPMTGILSTGGEGIEIRKPLAITVIFGLISSTMLTLVVIPVVYSWVENVKERFAAKTTNCPE